MSKEKAQDNFSNARQRVDELLAEQRVAKKALKNFNAQLDAELITLQEIEDVQRLFQSAVALMYSNLSAKLGDIITEGLTVIFPDSQYKFIVEFVERRNNVEADIYLEDSAGNKYDPLDDVGGGIADFVCFLLRITYIILSKYDNFLAADEPLKFVDRTRIPEAAAFIKKVCEDFKFQLLMITHIPEWVAESEIVYKVTKTKGTSKIKRLDRQ